MGSALLSFENQPTVSKPPRSVRYGTSFITFHADSADTSGRFAVLEMQGTPGSEPPPHVHRDEDELFYVLEGSLRVLRGSEELTLQSGQSAFLPRGVVHTFKVSSERVRFLVYITPGGFEGYFRDVHALLMGQTAASTTEVQLSAAEMIRLAGRYSVTIMP